MLKHYVEFFYPGSFFPETRVREIQDRTSPATNVPEGAYGWRVFSQETITMGGETLTGKPKDYGPMVYFGEIMTLEDVRALGGDYRILISNMEINGWDRVVRTVRGNFQPLNDGDVVLQKQS